MSSGSIVHQSPFGELPELPHVSLSEYVLSRTEAFGDKTAIIDPAAKRSISFADFADQSRRIARWLSDAGIGAGDTVALVSPNYADFALAFHGILAVGACVTAINPLSTAKDLEDAFAATGASAVIATATVFETVGALLDRREMSIRLCIGPDADRGPSFAATPLSTALNAAPLNKARSSFDPDATVMLPFSSGTSGRPKAVALSNRNGIAALEQLHAAAGVRDQDVMLGMLPFFHIYGMVALLNFGLSVGATMVTVAAPDFETVLKTIEAHRVTHAAVVAPIVNGFAKHPLADHFDLCSLRVVQCGATALDAEVARSAADRIGAPVVSGYGLTETTTIVSVTPPSAPLERHAAAGRLVPGTSLRVIDIETGRDLPAGQSGEFCVKGPQVMAGYHGNDEATRETFTTDGWLRTGDFGEVTEDGYLYIHDRLKEFIKYKGYQVAPAEIEGVLLNHPAITDAAVIGSPDAEAGEVPKAFVVRATDVEPQAIIDFVAGQVAPYKKLREVAFVDSIPKTAAGKILRRELVARERAEREAATANQTRLRDRVIVERNGAVLTIVLDRPRKANAFDPDMFFGLAEALTVYEDDPALRCAVLAANGPVFSSGLDLMSSGPLAARGELGLPEDQVDLLGFMGGRERTKPVIAAVSGKVLNLGVELMLACDFAVAGEGTIFAQQEVTRGIYPFGGATIRLPMRMGTASALRFILTGEAWSVEEAQRLALVQDVVPTEGVRERAEALAQKIAGNAPLGVKAALRNTRTLLTKGTRAAFAELPGDIQSLTSSEDFAEGVRSFVEKREPRFHGR